MTWHIVGRLDTNLSSRTVSAMESNMSRRMVFIGLTLILVLPCLSFAPAATDDQTDLKALAQVRYQAARELFDESWLMYKRKLQPEGVVYMFSHRLLLSQLDSRRDDRREDCFLPGTSGPDEEDAIDGDQAPRPRIREEVRVEGSRLLRARSPILARARRTKTGRRHARITPRRRGRGRSSTGSSTVPRRRRCRTRYRQCQSRELASVSGTRNRRPSIRSRHSERARMAAPARPHQSRVENRRFSSRPCRQRT